MNYVLCMQEQFCNLNDYTQTILAPDWAHLISSSDWPKHLWEKTISNTNIISFLWHLFCALVAFIGQGQFYTFQSGNLWPCFCDFSNHHLKQLCSVLCGWNNISWLEVLYLYIMLFTSEIFTRSNSLFYGYGLYHVVHSVTFFCLITAWFGHNVNIVDNDPIDFSYASHLAMRTSTLFPMSHILLPTVVWKMLSCRWANLSNAASVMPLFDTINP